MRTGLTPSATGSAYLELEQISEAGKDGFSLTRPSSTIKLTCTVHGPRPLPRSAPFSPNILLSTYVKFAPFASRRRRGYIRDTSERDLTVHLESALRGVIIGERRPKSGLDVVVTVLEGQDDEWENLNSNDGGGLKSGPVDSGMMSILAGCITVASAAIADAGIDCVDLITGGVAAIVLPMSDPTTNTKEDMRSSPKPQIVLDPGPLDDTKLVACCVLGYLKSRDEITQLWVRGGIPTDSGEQDSTNALVDAAVRAAIATRPVLVEAINEGVAAKLPSTPPDSK